MALQMWGGGISGGRRPPENHIFNKKTFRPFEDERESLARYHLTSPDPAPARSSPRPSSGLGCNGLPVPVYWLGISKLGNW